MKYFREGLLAQAMMLFFWLPLGAQPAGYYDTTEGKAGEELQQALHEVIDNHTVLSYSALWTAFQSTDKKADGTVWDMYSDVPGGSPPYVYTFGSDQCGNYSGEGSCYNREHSFPKSWFNDASPMYTDLFHLYPTDGSVNGKRSNFPYGETDNPTWTSLNGCKVGPSSVNGYSGTIFEPIDEYKGDFARTYFYMATRYYEEDAGWPGSPMVDGAQLEPWAREMLYQWHEEDPVSQKEIDRNKAVYLLQGNRNPFIDRPEFAERMYMAEGFDAIPPDVDSITVSSVTGLSIWFNEPLDAETATLPGNYSLSSGISVISAAMANEENSIVDLTVDQVQNGNYTLTINGVTDTAGNALVLAIFPFTISGLTHIKENISGDLIVYPNPGDGIFFVVSSFGQDEIDKILVSDMSGKSYMTEYKQFNNMISLDLHHLDGQVVLSIFGKNGQSLSKTLIIR